MNVIPVGARAQLRVGTGHADPMSGMIPEIISRSTAAFACGQALAWGAGRDVGAVSTG